MILLAGKRARPSRPGNVSLRLQLLGGRKYEIVEQNPLHVERAHISLSQSWFMDQ